MESFTERKVLFRNANFQDEVKTLAQLGLTFCEARVYLTLAHSGICSAKTISKASKVSKPDVYRVLSTLQERALVEKIISFPVMFKAVPIEQSLSILFQSRDKEHNLLREKTEKMIHDFKISRIEESFQEGEQQFILIPGKEAELERRRKETKSAEESIDIMNSWKRFPKTMLLYTEENKEALRRGVKMRLITEESKDRQIITEYYKEIRKVGSFRIRYVLDPLGAVISIYDKRRSIVTTSPGASLGEAAILWTNNLSIVTVMSGYFEMLWAKAVPYEDQESFLTDSAN